MSAVTHMSRFVIHDDESAPAGSVPILKGASSAAGQLPNLLGVLGGSPAALRGYVRLRHELSDSSLGAATVARLGLAVAAQTGSEPGLEQRTRSARQAGIGLDEIRRARAWESADPHEAALLRWAREVAAGRGEVTVALHEAAKESGWSEAQMLEAIAVLALETFAAWVNVAGDVPVDGSGEQTRQLRAVA